MRHPFRRPTLPLLAFSFLFTACFFQPKEKDERPSVCGNVLDAGTREALADAAVRIRFCVDMSSGLRFSEQINSRTDGQGYFELRSRNCQGNFRYEILIEKEGYEAYARYDYQLISGWSKGCHAGEYALDSLRIRVADFFRPTRTENK